MTEYPNEDVQFKADNGLQVKISTYYSMAEFAQAADRRSKDPFGKLHDRNLSDPDRWAGGSNLSEMVSMATGDGWSEMLEDTLTIAEQAVSMADREHEIQSFEPFFDVAGDEVDVDRFLSGEPECMIDYPLAVTSKVGKVVTLVVQGCVSAAIDPEDYQRRGQVLAALAIALERLGHSCELWLDIAYNNHSKKEYHTRILVKGTADQVDPAMIMLAFAHPGTLRRLGFADQDGSAFSRGWAGRGMPMPSWREGMPEGAIFTPELRSGYARHDTHEELRKYLDQLGLLAPEG